jgi:hypothetical protein
MSNSAKLGRNSCCSCGSGKKYKKCCLILNKSSQSIIDASINRFKYKSSDNTVFASADELGVRKMSEIILEYAKDLLKLTSKRKEKEDFVEMAIAAWNISFADADKRFNLVDSFVCDVCGIEKNSSHWKKMISVILMLVSIKLEKYSSIDRPVLDYEFIKLNREEYHLNVISGMAID